MLRPRSSFVATPGLPSYLFPFSRILRSSRSTTAASSHRRPTRPSTARILYLNFREYQLRWEEIASIFSRDAILKGSFDRFADSSKRKKGIAEVDAAFLAEIEAWRATLARNLEDW